MFAQKNRNTSRSELLNKVSLDLLFKQSNSNNLINNITESQSIQPKTNFNSILLFLNALLLDFGNFPPNSNNEDGCFNPYYTVYIIYNYLY